MPSTPHTTPKDAKAGRLNITDLMNIGIFFVINLVAGVVIAFIGITPITYVMITSVQALILGIPMMLFLAKVHKPGMVFIFLLLSGLASLLLGLDIWPPAQLGHGRVCRVNFARRQVYERNTQCDRLCLYSSVTHRIIYSAFLHHSALHREQRHADQIWC